jgi:hypothetical protein
MKNLLLLFLTICTLSSVYAQGPRKAERQERIKALWTAFLTQELELTSDESAKFWPIYNEYSQKERELNQKRVKMNALQSMSEAEIDNMYKQSLTNDEKIIELKREYYPKLKTAVPAHKIVKIPAAEREFKKKLLRMIQERRNK